MQVSASEAGKSVTALEADLLGYLSFPVKSPHPHSSFVRFHVGSEQGVDPRLIPRSLCLEPLQDLAVQANGDSSFWLREPEYGTLEERFALFRNIGSINLRVFEGINSYPVRPRSLLGSGLLHVCSPFVLR